MGIIKSCDGIIDVPDDGVRLPYEIIDPDKIPGGMDLLISEGAIRARVDALAKEICRDYDGDIYGVPIMKGAMTFYSDLSRAVWQEGRINMFLCPKAAISYDEKDESTGRVGISRDTADMEGRDILIVEDLIDTGLTLDALTRHLMDDKGAGSARICCLADKRSMRQFEVEVHYTGFIVPDRFIIGYGMDSGQGYRNLPAIYAKAQKTEEPA